MNDEPTPVQIDDLLPCPFCGATPERRESVWEFNGLTQHLCGCTNDHCAFQPGTNTHGIVNGDAYAWQLRDINPRTLEQENAALRARIAELEAERAAVPWEDISVLMKSIHPGRLDCDWTLLESYVRVDAWREQYRPPAPA